MPVIAAIAKCKKCGAEVRSDWKFCPNYADKITCTVMKPVSRNIILKKVGAID
jgi:hypothetical protein